MKKRRKPSQINATLLDLRVAHNGDAAHLCSLRAAVGEQENMLIPVFSTSSIAGS